MTTSIVSLFDSRDGRLKRGDELLMINGKSLIGLSHSEAVDVLRSSPKLVQIVVASKVSTCKGQTTQNKLRQNGRLIKFVKYSPPFYFSLLLSTSSVCKFNQTNSCNYFLRTPELVGLAHQFCASLVSVCSKFIKKNQLKLSHLSILCEIYILLFLIFRLY